MSGFQHDLPQFSNQLFLTDGGLETTLIFHDGLELPYFAAFDLMTNPEGKSRLIRYFERYISIARADGLGFILESPTWRASQDWGDKMGYSRQQMDTVNRESITLMRELRNKHQTQRMPMVVSGCVGPRGDGYDPGQVMTAAEAENYHTAQIGSFAAADADMITAITMTNANEAIGVTRAVLKAGKPVAISFTLETDGRLPTGQTLGNAIGEVDAATAHGPAYYMINCAHPTHFASTLPDDAPWTQRVRGLRANASKRSHQELNDSPDLDEGDPTALGQEYRELLRRHPQINVLGGCCGTDHRHVESISQACRCAA